MMNQLHNLLNPKQDLNTSTKNKEVLNIIIKISLDQCLKLANHLIAE